MEQTDIDTIKLEWCTEDILHECPRLTKDQARKVLEHCLRKHDATIGLSWDVIRCHADTLFPTRDEDIFDPSERSN